MVAGAIRDGELASWKWYAPAIRDSECFKRIELEMVAGAIEDSSLASCNRFAPAIRNSDFIKRIKDVLVN